MDSGFTIKKCERAEYEKFLLIANEAFDFGANSQWFQTHMPNCTPYEPDAKDSEIENHYITLYNGEIVGGMGAYPIEWIVSENIAKAEKISVKAFGIGQVCCKKEYRGKGVMSSMLERAKKDQIDGGALMAFLGGDRHRYGHFGFDFAGNNVMLGYSKHRMSKKKDPISVKSVEFSDYEKINAMYENLPSYIKRDKRSWEKQLLLKRENYSWYIGENNGKEAYICINDSNDIVETQGNISIIKSLVLWLMEEKSIDYVNIHYPLATGMQDPVYEALYSDASDISLHSIDMAAICAPEKLFTLLTPVLIRQGFENNIKNLDAKGKLAIVKKLLGFNAIPVTSEIAPFSEIRPLVFWLPVVDNV